MITKEELRIGNWVKWPKEKEPNEVQWEHGHWLGIYENNYSLSDCEGIPLTPEWMERLGLLKTKESTFLLGSYEFVPYENGFRVFLYRGLLTTLYNVHQLQNLYFALTGNELTVKA